MYTACYDNRSRLPLDVLFFLAYTASRINIHFLWSQRSFIPPKLFWPYYRPPGLHVIPTQGLPYYGKVQTLFDSLFVNYSTNPEAFERACFHRWFALNSATNHLRPHDYVCLLDTDFLIGIVPSELLNLCLLEASCTDLDLIADWDVTDDDAICPAITIIKKTSLHDFCRYLIVHYFQPGNRPSLLSGYFDRVGHALPGGICDMRALSSWRKEHQIKSFNLRSCLAAKTISSLNDYISQQSLHGRSWEIRFFPDRQELCHSDHAVRLAGTHFQGDAKYYLRQMARTRHASPVLSLEDVKRHAQLSMNPARRLLRRLIRS
jgi:hypothetical protein